jgi:hypothetical protein
MLAGPVGAVESPAAGPLGMARNAGFGAATIGSGSTISSSAPDANSSSAKVSGSISDDSSASSSETCCSSCETTTGAGVGSGSGSLRLRRRTTVVPLLPSRRCSSTEAFAFTAPPIFSRRRSTSASSSDAMALFRSTPCRRACSTNSFRSMPSSSASLYALTFAIDSRVVPARLA